MLRVPRQIVGRLSVLWTGRIRRYGGGIQRKRKPVASRGKFVRDEILVNDLLFGLGPCLGALRARRRIVHEVYLRNDYAQRPNSRLDAIVDLAHQHDIPLKGVAMSKLTQLSEKRPHQGVILVASPLEFEHQEFLTREEQKDLQSTEDGTPSLWLLLDGIQDPMNFGALLRTCQFLGVDRVIASQKNCAPLSPVVSKASAGAMETHSIFAVGSVLKFLEHSSLCGWEVLGASCAAEDSEQSHETVYSTEELALHGPTILVLGNEGRGLRPSVANVCSRLITIPPSSTSLTALGLDSLNVSVAAGILIFILKQKLRQLL